ncbi:MAG: T9SS type A sorting domain-containing protein [Saprospiraceae bacterium]|nr:T9SS type A sorting domain-containing protein [Saprospiraceae bacterium]MCF8250104.1 T9SS type A sorting domain-containing protein [Saprospiraceae bacterium]MCF8279566.1 T9SS type A sorting domain-containing protein [Bacteroidales bacterium]MCF8311930.1 T9SS type A sorting domain-containing protein [Saprospiraceae bacterium]MCF8440380.1 T9SS type A sorting domain-containing protein [Saprospiraceae bacterium]
MEQNNGLGKVIEKNVLVLEDTMHSGDLTAVKHNNNVDWWIITPKRTSNVYFKIHFTPNGIESVNTQSIGDSTLYAGDGGGQAIFSPNGTKYIRYNPADDIQIFDFDRSTGELSNYQHIIIPQDTAFVGGAAISPNSRYLYISSQVKFYQYDLQAPDIAASQVLLGEYDGYMSPFATTFFSCQLAPDCKIYCCTYNGCDVLHVVNYPDEPGLACDFVQHGVQLPSYNTLSMPNFPNYRLGTGQPVCVPTANDEVKLVQSEIKVYPNPANGQVTVLLPAPLYNESTWSLHDALGREVASAVLSAPQGQAGKQEAEVGLAGVASGLYFWRVVNGRGTVGSGKLIIIKD